MARKPFTTSLEESLIRELKVLAIDQGCNANDLLEEAIADLLKKYSAKKTRATKKR